MRYYGLSGCLLLALSLGNQCPAAAQLAVLDSVIQSNRYTVQLSDGKLTGPAADFLAGTTRDCQFVAIGEEHFFFDIPLFTTGLFSLLNEKNGFEYLALEQDPLGMQILSRPAYRGNKDSAFALARHTPMSYMFNTDQEIQMIAEASRLSRAKGHPVWGCDQAFGAAHFLKELLPLASSKVARNFTRILMDSALVYDNNRGKARHFMSQVCKQEDITMLEEMYKPAKGSYAAWLIRALQVSQQVYASYFKGEQGIPGGYYRNGYQREEYMKERIMEEYNYARVKGDKTPRALLKFGQFHVMNGLGPSRLETTGSFVRALAKSNGMQSFYISASLFEHPDTLAQSSYAGSFLARYCKANEWTLIDLRPLRGYADMIRKSKIFKDAETLRLFLDYIYKADAALLFGNRRPGSFLWQK